MGINATFDNFNSIKVRLKQRHTYLGKEGGTQFQFHKGTIKTQESQRNCLFVTTFQFHKGTIKTRIDSFRIHDSV